MSQDVKMECNVYLATPEPLTQMTANSYPLYFLQFGTGLAAVGDPYAKVSLDKWFNLDGKDALLMLNKPGMSFDPSAPGKTVINHSYFDYYTPNNLITCGDILHLTEVKGFPLERNVLRRK